MFRSYFFQLKSGPAFLICSRKFTSAVLWVIKIGVEILCFQLEVHVRDECPATEVQCEYKNLGCEEVVWTFYAFKIFLTQVEFTK